jgi:hypothetical protein
MAGLESIISGVTSLWSALAKDGPVSGSTLLCVRLLLRSDRAYVGFELSTSEKPPEPPTYGSAQDQEQEQGKPVTWEIPFAAFVAAEGREPGECRPLEVPTTLVDDLRYCLERLEGASQRPLWLRLVRPYGLLGAVQWERTLCGELKLPTLRLPDFPERPAERADVLENAVVVDPPPDADEGVLKQRVRAIIDAVLSQSARSGSRVHVFTRRRWYPTLSLFDADSRVKVYNPDREATRDAAAVDLAGDSPDDLLRSARSERAMHLRSAAWSSWIAGVLDGRGLDALHLVCRAKWTDAGACIVLSDAPKKEEGEITLREIGYEELELLAIRSGAWSVTFVPATIAESHPMACVADGFAQRRAGAVLFHTLCNPRDYTSFVAACKLLFGGAGGAPRMTEGFLYCHPGFVYRADRASEDLVARTPELFRFVADNAQLLAERAPWKERAISTATRFTPLIKTREVTAPPGWLGAAQRFLEAAAFEEVRRSASDLLLSKPLDKSAQTVQPTAQSEGTGEREQQDAKKKATIDILTEIQRVMQNHAKSNKEES